MYITYFQLFGYDEETRTDDATIKAALILLAGAVAFVAIILFVAHRINKRSSSL